MYRAQTQLATDASATAVDGELESLRARWNQFGVTTIVGARAAPAGGVTVHYRMVVDGHPDAAAVHAAFRGDLDLLLARLAAPPEPVSWDLAEMARAAAERGSAGSTDAQPRAYEDG